MRISNVVRIGMLRLDGEDGEVSVERSVERSGDGSGEGNGEGSG